MDIENAPVLYCAGAFFYSLLRCYAFTQIVFLLIKRFDSGRDIPVYFSPRNKFIA